MDRKHLFILLMRISAVVAAILGLFTVFFDLSVIPSIVGVLGIFLFRFLAVREIERENKGR